MTFWVVPAVYVLLLRRPPDGSDGPDEVLLQLRHNTGWRDGHWAVGAAGRWDHSPALSRDPVSATLRQPARTQRLTDQRLMRAS